MDKASRAIRRSGVKLLSLSGGHGDLNVLVSDIKDIKNCAKAFMNAQHLASQDMSRWAAHEENRAVQDVASKIAELLQLWSEVQKTFIGNLKDYRQMFEMILEGEKNVSQARDNLDYYQEKEMKGRKEMKKVAKRASALELRILQSRVEMAEKARECAQVELNERVRENEAVKLIRLKEGLLKISSSYIEMANKCNTIFMAERDIAIQLPDVHGRELETIKYSGFETTKFILEKAREKVQSYSSSDVSSDPPPPYTPPESSRQSSHQNSAAEASGIHHSYSDQRLAQSQVNDTPNVRPISDRHRHSLPYDTRPVPGRRQSCDPRLSSSSESNMCQMNQYAECSNIPSSGSSQSLPREGNLYPTQGVIRENSTSSVSSQGSAHGIASLAQNIATSAEGMTFASQGQTSPQSMSVLENENSPGQQGALHNVIHQQPTETIIHTNIVQIRQVVDLPSYEDTCSKSRLSLGSDYTVDSQNSARTATEHSCGSARVEENIQFADDDEESIPDGARSLRPVPAPRRCSSGEGYTTAEEDPEAISRQNH